MSHTQKWILVFRHAQNHMPVSFIWQNMSSEIEPNNKIQYIPYLDYKKDTEERLKILIKSTFAEEFPK